MKDTQDTDAQGDRTVTEAEVAATRRQRKGRQEPAEAGGGWGSGPVTVNFCCVKPRAVWIRITAAPGNETLRKG